MANLDATLRPFPVPGKAACTDRPARPTEGLAKRP
jgi:hypothetical protein